MSRRNRHARHQHPVQGPRTRPTNPSGERPGSPTDAGQDLRADARPGSPSELRSEVAGPRVAFAEARPEPPARPEPVNAGPAVPVAPPADPVRDALGRADGGIARPTCTVAQLRRFIKSRPWVPLHELRRRFGIYGGDDDVSPIRVGDHVLFIGLPPPESGLIAELLAGGDVGYELGLDPRAPIVVGVYPMRPVPRG